MKLQGSKTTHIVCCECNTASPTFRVTLYEEDGERLWIEKQLPSGWETDEEAGFWDDPEGEFVMGFCPLHRG